MSKDCPATGRYCLDQQRCADGCSLAQRLGYLPDISTRGEVPAVTIQQPDRLQEAANAIRAKLKEEKATYQHYLDHCQKMKDIEDLHGGWDSFANASEVSNRIDTLVWCLEQMGCEP